MSGCEEPSLFYFIGVSTRGSSIRSVFPDWMTALGQNAELFGVDIPVRAEASKFRDVLIEFKNNERARGALVTTHKIDLFRSCADLFDEIDPIASALGEVSCIVNDGGSLKAYAIDPRAAGAALEHFMEPQHWQRHNADLICLGAGGAGLAISYVAIADWPEDDRPDRIIMADTDSGRLEMLCHIHDRLQPSMPIQYHRIMQPQDADALVARARPYSLIVNATGLGKDRPGSPLSDNVKFPQRTIVWELNYRGERSFLNQANRQAEEQSLKVSDGWHYFIHGWTGAIATVFDIEMTEDRLAELARIADPDRQ